MKYSEQQIDTFISEEIDIRLVPFCPICNNIEDNKGSYNIKVCKKCQKVLLNKLKNNE
jgi:ribosomal protein L37AE/L43A